MLQAHAIAHAQNVLPPSPVVLENPPPSAYPPRTARKTVAGKSLPQYGGKTLPGPPQTFHPTTSAKNLANLTGKPQNRVTKSSSARKTRKAREDSASPVKFHKVTKREIESLTAENPDFNRMGRLRQRSNVVYDDNRTDLYDPLMTSSSSQSGEHQDNDAETPYVEENEPQLTPYATQAEPAPTMFSNAYTSAPGYPVATSTMGPPMYGASTSTSSYPYPNPSYDTSRPSSGQSFMGSGYGTSYGTYNNTLQHHTNPYATTSNAYTSTNTGFGGGSDYFGGMTPLGGGTEDPFGDEEVENTGNDEQIDPELTGWQQ